MVSLIQLTENDKRLIIAVLLIAILFFVIAGYLSLLVKKIMKSQAKSADNMIHDVYASKLITKEKDLKFFGIKKNHAMFFKQASIPMIILGATWLIFLLYGIIFKNNDFTSINFWDYGTIPPEGGTAVGGTGITTLFYVFDWKNAPSVEFFGGLKLFGKPPLLNVPHFSVEAIFSYIFIPLNVIGIVWLLVCVQAYIARSFRIFKLASSLFKKTLDNPMSNNQQNNVK